MHRPLRLSLFLLIVASLTVACGGSGDSGSASGTGTTPAFALKAFGTDQALEVYLKGALLSGTTRSFPSAGADFAATAPTGATPGYSTTNLQEAGVDEADRFKSDGRHFYILGRADGDTRDTLRARRLAAVTAGQEKPGSTPIASLPLPEGAVYRNAYLVNARPGGLTDILLAIGERGGYRFPAVGGPQALARDWFVPWDWRAGQTDLTWVDIADPGAPKPGLRVTVDGFHVASRRIGEIVYLVTRFTPNLPGILPYPADERQRAANQAAVDAASLADLLPKWSLDGVAQGTLVNAASCFRDDSPEVAPSADIIIVTAVNLGDPRAAPRAQCLTGGSEALYVSNEALYVASSNSVYSVQPAVGASATALAVYPESMATRIHKFALDAQGPAYRGSGSVAGHLGWEQGKKSFRMGEHQGVLRVVTSLGQTWDGSASTRLSLLREAGGKLDKVGELPNARRPAALGKPGESLYAARFIGARGYLVTFRVTDPLYVLDLADPSDPRIAGELAIPGYSDYLHPLGERWLIGVGKDAVADTTGTLGDARGAWYQGVKVALFDVADPARPREVGAVAIGKRGSQSAALYDHHAFTLLETGHATGELARLALPVERHDLLPAGGDANDPRTWYEWRDTGLHLFSVTDAGLLARGTLIAETRDSNGQTRVSGHDDRAFLNGQEVHYLHGQEMWASAW